MPTSPPSELVRNVWYAAMALGGIAFGLIGERRPFGDGIFAHPLVALFILVGIALLVLRIVLARPVPEVIPERALLVGCVVALAAFLLGNFVSAHVIPAPLPSHR
jgi:drug/metabolite transporter (DMT)-like permease